MLDVDRLNDRVREGIAAARIAGVSLAVLHEGELIHAEGYGVTSVEDGGLAVTPDTLFRIASTTKTMVAAVLLQLVGDGLVDLDAPVRTYLPWLTLSDAAAADAVTVRQVMSGQSGLPADNYTAGGQGEDALERFVREQVPDYRLVAPPGQVFVYSNPAVNVAGLIAEKVSGVAFPKLVQERLFEPLGMKRSTFDPLVAMTYPLAQPHRIDDDGTLRVVHRFSDNRAAYPAGGAFSTATDMVSYARMLLDGGAFNGRQVLGSRELAQMTTPQTRTFWPQFAPTASYGLMLFVESYKGHRRWCHPGGAGGFMHTFHLMPDTRSAVIMQANGAGPGFSGHTLADEIFDELLGLPADWSEPPAEDTSRWASYVGRYVNDTAVYEGATPLGTVDVDVIGDQLVATHNGTKKVLSWFAPDFYRAATGNSAGANPEDSGSLFVLGFYPDAQGSVDWVSLNMQPARRLP